MNPSIILSELSIGYTYRHRKRVVAHGISAKVYPRELTCLLGSNGVGKSTLLRTLTASLPMLSGTVELLGRTLDSYRERDLARCVSVVLTERPQLRNMSVKELVALGRSPYTGYWGRLNARDYARVMESLAWVGIAHLADRTFDTLSDGERQKAMIAKALAQDTPIMLLDEPTAFLDFPSKVEIMRLLYRLSRVTGKTVFMVTHDLDLALQIADKVWLMDGAASLHIGTPEDLVLRGDLQHFFNRDDISFDSISGLFRVAYTMHRTLRLTGSGSCVPMIRKALQRHGISVEEGGESFDSIDVTANGSIVYNAPDGVHTPVESIEELLRLVDGKCVG